MLDTPYQGVGKLRTFFTSTGDYSAATPIIRWTIVARDAELLLATMTLPTPIDGLAISARVKIGYRNADSLIKNGTVTNDLKRGPTALLVSSCRKPFCKRCKPSMNADPCDRHFRRVPKNAIPRNRLRDIGP
jgi:hypothetical protein